MAQPNFNPEDFFSLARILRLDALATMMQMRAAEERQDEDNIRILIGYRFLAVDLSDFAIAAHRDPGQLALEAPEM